VSQAEIDLARYMQDEAGRIAGIRQDLDAPVRMDVAAIIAECLRAPPEPVDAEAMAERIVAALDTAARAKPERQYQPGDLVQVHPDTPVIGGCPLFVTEILSTVVIGFVQASEGRRTVACVPFHLIEHTGGRAVWAPPGAADGEGR
jgi:hypothetical protein